MKTVKEMKPGVKYPGYGFINEYNEFQFTPSEVGSQKGRKLLVKEDKNYSVYKTTKYILFHCKIERRLNVANRLNEIISLMNKFISIVREYEF